MQTQTNTLATPEPTATPNTSTFWADFNEAVADEEAKRKEAKRLEQIAGCHSWAGVGENPLNGRFVRYQIKCGHWRDCACRLCMDLRIDEIKERLYRALRDGKIHIRIAFARELITNGLSKDKYLSMPIKTESTKTFKDNFAIFVKGKDESGVGVDITKEWIDRLSPEHWIELCNTPKGSRMSGTLGALKKKKKGKLEPGQVRVQYKSIVYHPDNDEQLNKEAEKMAIEATKKLDPRDEESLQEALVIRMTALKKCVIELGGKFSNGIMRFNTVTLSMVRWR